MLKLKFRDQTLELRRKMSLQLHRLLEDMASWTFNENEAQKCIDEYALELVEKITGNKIFNMLDWSCNHNQNLGGNSYEKVLQRIDCFCSIAYSTSTPCIHITGFCFNPPV